MQVIKKFSMSKLNTKWCQFVTIWQPLIWKIAPCLIFIFIFDISSSFSVAWITKLYSPLNRIYSLGVLQLWKLELHSHAASPWSFHISVVPCLSLSLKCMLMQSNIEWAFFIGMYIILLLPNEFQSIKTYSYFI